MFKTNNLNVGVGGPECGDGPKPEDLPGSGLLVTNLKGFGGGKKVGGSGGPREPKEPSDGAIGLVQSVVLLYEDTWLFTELYS